MKRKTNGAAVVTDQRSKKVKVTNNKKKKKVKRTEREIKSGAYFVVPWVDGSNWDSVCLSLRDGKYEDVIRELMVWKERVPALAVGAESTLVLLQALVFDQKDEGGNSEDQSRALYSLAVVRYMNLISQLATKETGNAPMARLATHVNVPDWIVDLRHEVSHGSSLPSLDVLRSAADFILRWLSDHYWVLSEGSVQKSILTATKDREDAREEDPAASKEEVALSASRAISNFIACKIYRLRGLKRINDPEVTQHIEGQPASVTPKQAMGTYKTTLANLLTSDFSTLCSVFAQEMIPTEEFIQGLSSIFDTEDPEVTFSYYAQLWIPLTELMKRRHRIALLCTLLGNCLVTAELSKTGKLFCALWLDRLLEILEEDEKKYPLRLKKILKQLMGSPDPIYAKFLPRLLHLLEDNLGSAKVQQLQDLFDIWTDDSIYSDETPDSARNGFFSMDDVRNSPFQEQPLEDEFHLPPATTGEPWSLDRHGQSYWRKIPLGTDLGESVL